MGASNATARAFVCHGVISCECASFARDRGLDAAGRRRAGKALLGQPDDLDAGVVPERIVLGERVEAREVVDGALVGDEADIPVA